ncbi:Hypothetical_protein [Hexamita inflata]|uniref:Hypothetical_protein n=1 Tax=Hexamita inflata TaxID=28002 RepID=A0ABP1LPX1_9EUKA
MQYQTTRLTVTLSSVLRLDSIIPSQILHLTYYVVNNLFLNCAQTYSKFNWGALFLNNNKRDRKGNALVGSLFMSFLLFVFVYRVGNLWSGSNGGGYFGSGGGRFGAGQWRIRQYGDCCWSLDC